MLWAIRTKSTERRESLLSRLSYMLLLVGGFYLIFAHNVRIRWLEWHLLPRDRWMTAVGVSITAIGRLFAVSARAYLGTNWRGMVTLKSGNFCETEAETLQPPLFSEDS
jgi:hypothetical protein